MAQHSLYTVRTGESYQVLKFDEDLEHLETYSTSAEGCTCPAGHMDTCRHRQILGLFLETDRVNSGWFVDWDRTKWHNPIYGFSDNE